MPFPWDISEASHHLIGTVATLVPLVQTGSPDLSVICLYSLALLCGVLGLVRAEEELPVEELHPDHGEDEEEEHVYDEDVEHILERDHNAVEHSLEGGHPVHHLQGPEHAQKLHRLQLLTRGSAAAK